MLNIDRAKERQNIAGEGCFNRTRGTPTTGPEGAWLRKGLKNIGHDFPAAGLIVGAVVALQIANDAGLPGILRLNLPVEQGRRGKKILMCAPSVVIVIGGVQGVGKLKRRARFTVVRVGSSVQVRKSKPL
jgi:hypothetical protein